MVAHAEAGDATDTRGSYGWSAPHIAEAVKQLVGVARMRGIATALHRSAAARRTPREGVDDQALDALFAGLRSAAAASSSPPARSTRGPAGGASAAEGASSGPLAGASAMAAAPSAPVGVFAVGGRCAGGTKGGCTCGDDDA